MSYRCGLSDQAAVAAMAGFDEQLRLFDQPVRGVRVVLCVCLFVGREEVLCKLTSCVGVEEELSVIELPAEFVHCTVRSPSELIDLPVQQSPGAVQHGLVRSPRGD